MSKAKMVTFTVVAADRGAEIFLIDGSFKLVKRGIGHETFSVPPGVYKIKSRAGRATTEKLVVVREGMMDPINLDPIVIDSAMPLSNSARTHEYHTATASRAGDSFAQSLGTGSSIVLVAREWTAKAPTGSAQEVRNPARGLALRDLSGTVLVDVEARTRVSGTFDQCVSLAIEVGPGAYCLSLTYGNGRRVEQILIASPGWQTQVYLLVGASAPADEARVDLINGSISYLKAGERFDPQDPKLRSEEIARGALQDSRHILSDEMRTLICSADASPMMALIGAHLLIREAEHEKAAAAAGNPTGKTSSFGLEDALRRIVQNLRQALGSHPDVETIATVAGNADQSFVFHAPPMFRASWPLLLRASVQQPEIIPATSFTAHVAERIWGEGAWLFWLDKDLTEAIDLPSLWETKAHEVLCSMSARREDVAQTPQPAISQSAIQAGLSYAADAAAAVAPTMKAFFARRSRTPFPKSFSSTPVAVAQIPRPAATRNSVQAGLYLAADTFAAVAPKVKAFLARRSTPFPESLSSTAADEAVMDVDLHGIREALSVEQRRELVEQVGVPMSTLNAWLDKI